MSELNQADVVYSPRSSLQLWNVFVNWLDFFYQFFLKILRPLAHHPFLSSKAISHGFKPLPVIELPEMAAEPPVTTIQITSGRTSSEGEVGSIQRLTVWSLFWPSLLTCPVTLYWFSNMSISKHVTIFYVLYLHQSCITSSWFISNLTERGKKFLSSCFDALLTCQSWCCQYYMVD